MNRKEITAYETKETIFEHPARPRIDVGDDGGDDDYGIQKERAISSRGLKLKHRAAEELRKHNGELTKEIVMDLFEPAHRAHVCNQVH